MGKWNHRWRPRRNYSNESSDFYSHHLPETLSPDDWKSNVPWWEKQFCLIVGSVPWKKVMVAKKYMYCHDNVVKWNDSANEEAFFNAKNRYRADLDGLPCDIPLPDPDIYLGEIDWNPKIDPKLIADLEKEYFNPDEGEKIKKVDTEEHISHKYNPWEGSEYKANEAAQNNVTQYWDDFIGEDNNKRKDNASENPWEQGNNNNKEGAVNDNKSWGWKQKEQVNNERLWSNNFNSRCSWQNIGSANEEGWCSSSNNYKGQNQINNDRNYLDSRRGSGVSNVGQLKKREGSHQYSSRHKNPRFYGNDCNWG